MKKDFQFKALFFRVFAVFCFLFISQSVFAQVSGTVFRDYNSNGVKDDQHELGVKGVSVSATDAGGTVYGPVTTADDGTYTISGVPSGQEVRLEFSIPSTVGCYNEKVYESFGNSSNSTSVQFVKGGATNVNYGVNNPVDYAKTNPDIATTCFINGDITLPKTTVQFGIQVGVSDMDVALKFNYSKAIAIPSSAGSRNAGATPITPNNTYYSIAEKMGSVWGLAYQKDSKKLFMSAIMRRHGQFGPLGTGGIYVVNNADGNTFNVTDNRNFIDVQTIGINTGTDPHPLPATSTGNTAFDLAVCDAASFDKVGKIGIGDIDLSDDGIFLYMTNLNDRKLYRIKINNPATTPTSADVLSYDTAPWLSAGTCQNGIARPWATKYYRDKVYVGVVCTGENGGAVADLKAMVYELNAKTNVWNSTPTFTQTLDYTKGKAAGSVTTSIISNQGITWNPWTAVFPDPGDTKTAFTALYPSAILSDIEFDTDGSMILGFMDRFGHQAGSGTKIPKSDGSCIADPARAFGPYTSVSAGGDLLRIGMTTGCIYQAESNGTAAGKTSSGAGNNQGIGGGEYYSGDNIAGVEGNHEETFVGGLALLPGSNQVLGATYDPLGFVSGGINFFDNTTGKAPTRYEVYPPNNTPFPGKGNGVGDIELLLSNAPIQIGNRVWYDKDKDGIQDAEEKPLPNVKVALYNSSGVKVSEVVTNALGEYYFDTLNITGGKLLRLTNYEIRVATTNVDDYLTLTTTNLGANDAIDSDANLVGTDYVIPVTTGNYGENNHTYDIGFICVTLNAGTDQTFCQTNPATYDLANAPSNQEWIKLSGSSSINASTGAITGLTAGTHEFILKYTATSDCADTVKFVINIVPDLAITSTVATCPLSGGNANDDAKINLVNTNNGVKVDYTSGSTYTGTKSYASLPTGMPSGNVFTVPNPSVTKNFTVRLYNQGGTCFIDKTLEIKHVDCPKICPPNTCLPISSEKN